MADTDNTRNRQKEHAVEFCRSRESRAEVPHRIKTLYICFDRLIRCSIDADYPDAFVIPIFIIGNRRCDCEITRFGRCIQSEGVTDSLPLIPRKLAVVNCRLAVAVHSLSRIAHADHLIPCITGFAGKRHAARLLGLAEWITLRMGKIERGGGCIDVPGLQVLPPRDGHAHAVVCPLPGF